MKIILRPAQASLLLWFWYEKGIKGRGLCKPGGAARVYMAENHLTHCRMQRVMAAAR
jgi:hypothetical protein